MKKVMFMFVAVAAMSFASCTETKKQAEAVEETTTEAAVVELTAEDTTAALAVLGVDAAAVEADSTVAAKLQVALDSILAAKMVEAGEAVAELPTEEATTEEAPATEETPAQ